MASLSAEDGIVPSNVGMSTNAAFGSNMMMNNDMGNPTSKITLEAFCTILSRGSEYLTICDLGNLSNTSKTVGKLADESFAWAAIFESVAAAGAVCTPEDIPPWWFKNHVKSTWNSEPGLLECFSKPIPTVIARVGYKRASRCLISKTCALCGKMAASANPLLLARVCDVCSETTPILWFMGKSKAKEVFLLSEHDCSTLRNATIPFSLSQKPGAKISSSVLLLQSEVVGMSYAKHGGVDGLAAAIAKKKADAMARYQSRQASEKKPKKRPKIEHSSERPANDLSSHRFFGGTTALPVPTVYSGNGGPPSEMKMTHSTKCQFCPCRGTTNDICLHERLQHGWSPGEAKFQPEPCPPFVGIFPSIPAAIKPAQELVSLFANAEVKYSSFSHNFMDMNVGPISLRTFSATFSFGTCIVAIDWEKYIYLRDGSENVRALDVFYQTGTATPPGRLLSLQSINTPPPFVEATEKHFGALKDAMGLQEKSTSSSQLLASLLARAVLMQDFFHVHAKCNPSATEYPIIYGAWTLLKASLESNVGMSGY